MLNLKTPLLDITNQAYELARECFPDADIIKSAVEIRERLADYQPVMMFYGTYNSGKSTLLNTILGEAVAETADKPCTMRIEEYKLGDYTVYDTPGIDAPVEHERMSRAQLQRCHVIAFVISTSGGFDEKNTAKEISEVFESGKPIVLVLNNKSGLEMDSEELKSVLQKFLENCTRATGDRSFGEHIRRHVVNAKTALTARSKDKQGLYEASGVAALERDLLKILQQTGGNNLLTVSVGLLDDALTNLQHRFIESLDDHALSHQQQLIQQVKKARFNFEEQIVVDIRGLRGDLIREVVALFHQSQDINAALRNYIGRIEKKFENRAKQTLTSLEQDIEELTRQFSESIDIGASPQHVRAEVIEGNSSQAVTMIEKQARQIVNKTVLNQQQTQEALKQSMLILRKMKVPIFKGRWERTLTRWASHGAKALTVAIQVLTVAYDIYKAKKEQQRYEQQQREREETLNREARNLAEDCESEIISQVSDIAAQFFAPLQSEYEKTLANLSESSMRTKSNLEKIGFWQSQLQEVRTQIRM